MTSTQKTALITGATSGFGVYIARYILEQGYHLLLWARTEQKGKDTLKQLLEFVPDADVQIIVADLASLPSVRASCEKVGGLTEHLDLLVLNAGLWNFEPVNTEDGIEETLQVNLIAPVLIEESLHSLLLKAPEAKVIFTASGLHQGEFSFDDPEFRKGFSGFKAYRQSKLGIILMTRLLARQYKDTRIGYYCVHPGMVQTKLGQKAGWLSRTIFHWLGSPPEKGAETHRYVIGQPREQLFPGAYYAKCKATGTTAQSKNMLVAERLQQLIRNYFHRA